MKSLLQDILGKQSERKVSLNLAVWFKSLTSISRHLSHISPAMDFESVARHITDAICQGLSPLQPVAAHFHIDVSTSHLWLPDPTFRLDVYYRIQNRILMPSQSRPIEMSKENLFQTHVIVPFEMHKHAIEIMVYHKEDSSHLQQTVVKPVLTAFSLAVTQILLTREEHMMLKEQWLKESEKALGSRLGHAIYQVQSPFLFAQSLRGFSLPSSSDSGEHLFLNQNQSLGIFRFTFVKLNTDEPVSSIQRKIAFFASIAAQLRFFEHTASMSSFTDYLHSFSQCIQSLSHLITVDDKLSFIVGEFSQKSGLTTWHSAGMPSAFVFGETAGVIDPPMPTELPAYQLGSSHDWSRLNQLILPEGAGLFFMTENLIRRLHELNSSVDVFAQRLSDSTHAAHAIIEAEKFLSKPENTKVVVASVTDWSQLPYDISMLAVFNSLSATQPA